MPGISFSYFLLLRYVCKTDGPVRTPLQVFHITGLHKRPVRDHAADTHVLGGVLCVKVQKHGCRRPKGVRVHAPKHNRSNVVYCRQGEHTAQLDGNLHWCTVQEPQDGPVGCAGFWVRRNGKLGTKHIQVNNDMVKIQTRNYQNANVRPGTDWQNFFYPIKINKTGLLVL